MKQNEYDEIDKIRINNIPAIAKYGCETELQYFI